MFHTGLDPRDMKPVYVARNPHEKAMQRALMQYYIPGNHALVLEALRRAGREDLIGWGRECLIPPYLREKKTANVMEARNARTRGAERKNVREKRRGHGNERDGQAVSRRSNHSKNKLKSENLRRR